MSNLVNSEEEMVTNTEELYEYIHMLESNTVELENTIDRLATENLSMRRSLAGYKANATARRNRRVLESSVQ